jgi:hypothetical protein
MNFNTLKHNVLRAGFNIKTLWPLPTEYIYGFNIIFAIKCDHFPE